MPDSERIVAVVQARTGSTRFPGKVLADLAGEPMLARLLARVTDAHEPDAVAVATSVDPEDDPVAELAASLGVHVVRGPLEDVLERFRSGAAELEADAVVRLTGDCPLADPDVIDEVVRAFRSSRVDYACNIDPPTFPDGLDVEVIARPALEAAANEATLASDREHVTLFVRRRPERFTRAVVGHDPDLSELRWTVDYPDDLEFVRLVYAAFAGRERSFRLADVLRVIESDAAVAAAMPTHARDEGLAKSLRAERGSTA